MDTDMEEWLHLFRIYMVIWYLITLSPLGVDEPLWWSKLKQRARSTFNNSKKSLSFWNPGFLEQCKEKKSPLNLNVKIILKTAVIYLISVKSAQIHFFFTGFSHPATSMSNVACFWSVSCGSWRRSQYEPEQEYATDRWVCKPVQLLIESSFLMLNAAN